MTSVFEFRSYWQGPPPQVVFEAGARDCLDTLKLYRAWPGAQIYTFECNPRTLPECRARVEGIDNIHLIEKAVYSLSGPIEFYPTNPKLTITTHEDGNPGASSLFVANGRYPAETLVQDKIEVEAVTFAQVIEENNLPGVDALWLDLQGAELAALEGLSKYIQGVKLIMIEVTFQEMYSGQPLFNEVDKFMQDAGFEVVAWPYRDHWFANAIYRRRENTWNLA